MSCLPKIVRCFKKTRSTHQHLNWHHDDSTHLHQLSCTHTNALKTHHKLNMYTGNFFYLIHSIKTTKHHKLRLSEQTRKNSSKSQISQGHWRRAKSQANRFASTNRLECRASHGLAEQHTRTIGHNNNNRKKNIHKGNSRKQSTLLATKICCWTKLWIFSASENADCGWKWWVVGAFQFSRRIF